MTHADELAREFEDYEPEPADVGSVEEYMLRRAPLARARSERHIVDAIAAARAAGLSWARVGGSSARPPRRQQRNGEIVECV